MDYKKIDVVEHVVYVVYLKNNRLQTTDSMAMSAAVLMPRGQVMDAGVGSTSLFSACGVPALNPDVEPRRRTPT